MMMEISGDTLYFQAISRTGETIDAGAITRTRRKPGPAGALTAPSHAVYCGHSGPVPYLPDFVAEYIDPSGGRARFPSIAS